MTFQSFSITQIVAALLFFRDHKRLYMGSSSSDNFSNILDDDIHELFIR